MEAGKAFANAWPEAAVGVRAMLRNLGVAHADIEDVLQTTAERALEHDVARTDADGFRAWTHVVAKRVAIDEWRKTRPVQIGDVPELPANADVVDEVAARRALAQFRREAAALPAAERAAILSLESPISERRAAVALGVARHRARRKLRHIMEGLSVFVGGAQMRLRRAPLVRGTVGVAAAVAMATTVTSVLHHAHWARTRPRSPVAAIQHLSVSTAEARSTRVTGASPFGAHTLAAPTAATSPASPEAAPRVLPHATATIALVPTDDGGYKVDSPPAAAPDDAATVCTYTPVTPYGCYSEPLPANGVPT